MNETSLFARVASGLMAASLVAVSACAVAPGGESTASSAEAVTSCTALRSYTCFDYEGDGSTRGRTVCSCVATTGMPDANALAPSVCASSNNGGIDPPSDVPVPPGLQGLGCTDGTAFAPASTDTTTWTAVVWACPTPLPAGVNPYPDLPTCGAWIAEQTSCELVATGPTIDNSCVGSAKAGWTLVEAQIYTNPLSPGSCSGGCMLPGPTGCAGGCPKD